MKNFRPHLIVVALLAVASTEACAGTGGRAANATVSPPLSTAELEALYRARTDSTRLNVSEADVDFMSGMIGHHAQALVMSAFAPTHGASALVRTLAARITNAQKDEIALMQMWLRDRDRPVPQVGDTGHMMGGMDHDMMPGMLTPAQLEELGDAHGTTFDRAFLTYMIQHHQGAVTMVHELFATDGAAQDELIFKLASDVQVDQITEIARMQQMLAGLPAQQPIR